MKESSSRDVREIPTRKLLRITTKTEGEYEGMSIESLKILAIELLDHIEYVRNKSSNIQGRLKGILKDRVLSLKDVVKCFADTAEAVRDPILFKRKNLEIKAEIKRLNEEKNKLSR